MCWFEGEVSNLFRPERGYLSLEIDVFTSRWLSGLGTILLLPDFDLYLFILVVCISIFLPP